MTGKNACSRPACSTEPVPAAGARERAVSGFTLVELLVVVAIIGVLATMVVPVYTDYVTRSKNTGAKADITTLAQEINAYYIDRGVYPASLTDIGRGSKRDPWTQPYVYTVLRDTAATPLEDFGGARMNEEFDLYSKGANGSSAEEYNDDCKDDITLLNNGTSVALRGPVGAL